jgi:hypothetical protein
MRRGERSGSGSPENYSEILDQYRVQLDMLSTRQGEAAQSVQTTYEYGLGNLLETNGDIRQVEFDRLNGATNEQLNRCLNRYETQISGTFETTNQLVLMFPPHDRELWQKLQTTVSTFGISDPDVARYLNAASSVQSKRAMQAALDKTIWQKLQTTVSTFGISDPDVARYLIAASSVQSKRAMQAALDKTIWQKLQTTVSTFGISDPDVARYLNHSYSSKSARVMKRLLPQPSAGSDYAYEAPVAEPLRPRRTLLDRLLRRNKHRKHESYQQQVPPFGGTNFEDFMRQVREDHERMMKDLFDDLFQGAGGIYDVPPFGQSVPPRQETGSKQPQTEREKANQEAREIVRKAIAADRSAQWLARADVSSVRRVISTVRVLRTKAEESGDAISDRDIYIRYRRIVETNENASPQVEESLKILTALMGGSPSGKLPF